ncbi:peptidoglycan editing factor PgeF [Isoptericola sp. NEAU-Y5]|uniref:Purine nucleoside phosphorylase n=1 Tax=Isoptericola luteus TaxID=2879484 RepID=A0ABS7ZF95_9MICO|nr:peptidoglycan editing factor PgeF [Isoptericola sp. NEAU-Y5]MCA5893142.1 peptidoglycan editing factor PgeF [Isoptericola sp. NEAU-Y5]
MSAPVGWAQESLLPAQFGAGLLRVDLGAGVVAGFTTRHGGVSPAPWSSLDLGTSTGDDPVRVRENRARLERWVGAPVAFAAQVHGREVLELGEAERERWASDAPPLVSGEADALVTATAGLGLGVLVADCVPVVLADPVARVVAVAHAGRRGTELGVVDAVLDAMVARGARTADVRAAVGPAVCGRCYEVPAELAAQVSRVVPETASATAAGTPALDLPRGVLAQLAGRGVAAVHVDRCTLTDPDLYSHRRATAAGTTTGRQAGVVTLT